MIEDFTQLLDVEPVPNIPATAPQDALMGDECRCADCTRGEADEGDLQ